MINLRSLEKSRRSFNKTHRWYESISQILTNSSYPLKKLKICFVAVCPNPCMTDSFCKTQAKCKHNTSSRPVNYVFESTNIMCVIDGATQTGSPKFICFTPSTALQISHKIKSHETLTPAWSQLGTKTELKITINRLCDICSYVKV